MASVKLALQLWKRKPHGARCAALRSAAASSGAADPPGGGGLCRAPTSGQAPGCGTSHDHGAGDFVMPGLVFAVEGDPDKAETGGQE